MLRTELIASVPELLRRHAEAQGEKVAYRDSRRAVTYAELNARTARLGGHLADIGIVPGDTVALLLPNSVTWVEGCFAINRAGALSVPIAYGSSEPEILYRLADAGCKAIVTTSEQCDLIARLRAHASCLRSVIVVGQSAGATSDFMYDDLVATPPKSAAPDPADLHRPAFIVYTSGTTGRAKGVLLTLHGMLWVVAATWAPIVGLSAADTVLSPLPLFHSYALNLSVLGVLATGASEHIMERYSTKDAVDLLATGEFTVFPGVPTMFHYLLEAVQSRPEIAFPGLRLCVSAGAILPAALNRRFEDRVGVPLLDGYGITETSTMVTMNWPTDARVPGSCGLPIPGLAVRIVDPASLADMPCGQEGELIVRGPNVMPGYHDKPDETAKALRNGWYHTGDLARSDENGFLAITGRLKELIIRGGQNIAPAEIEDVVIALDSVLDCAVVGVAHDHLGEVPVLCVVARPGTTVELDALLEHCRANLSAYKVPHAVHVVDEIPRTGSGKIIRYKLQESLSARS